MQITQNQLSTLRSRPHQANLYLSIYQPKIAMIARVTGTYDIGSFQINYNSVTTGSYSNLYADMTVMVGSAPNTDDYGRIRLRSATSSYIVTAENAINWQSGQYLTFIKQIDIQAIYPRIIQDPANQTNVIFYKDYNIPYSNQNRIYGTFVNAGSHRAGFIPSGTFYFSATGTYNLLNESVTYDWAFEGGTPTGSTSLTPGNVVWTTPGHYEVRLRVTSASGAVDETYRYVSLYRRPEESATDLSVQKWEMSNFSGSRGEGGYTVSFKVYEDIGEVQPNALVVLFSDNFYGGSRQNIGGNGVNNSSIMFVGYIIGDSIRFNYEQSSVEFTVGSVSEIMKGAEGFSVSCESKVSPSTWFELYEMNVPRAMYHYLRWHSTVLKVTDFQYIGDDRLVQYFDADRGSLFDAVDSFMRDGMLGEVVADRQGKVWAEISPFGYENPFTSIPNYLTLHKQDWMDEPSISERRNSDMSFIELGGIIYYGASSNLFSAVLSNAPSTVPLYHGKSDRKEGLILNSQAQLNQVTGNYLANFNTRFPEIVLNLNGIYTNLDIAPQERLLLVVSREDSVRNKSLQNFSYLLTSMEWRYSSVKQSLTPSLTLSQIATGTAGVTVQIPVVPPENGYSYPSLSLPTLPTFGGSTPRGSTIGTRVVFWDNNYGFILTDNFDSTNPSYTTVNSGLTTTQYQNANFMFVCPNGAFYVGRCGTISFTNKGIGWYRSPFIARAPYVGGTFTIIEDESTLWTKYPTYPTSNHAIKACSFNPLLPESVAYIMGEDTSTIDFTDFDIRIGAAGSYAVGAHITSISPDQSQNGLSYCSNPASWVYTGARAQLFNPAGYWRFNATATTLQAQGQFGDISEYSHMRPGTLPTIYTLGLVGGDIRKSTDNGSTWNQIGNTLLHGGDGLSFEPTLGMYAMLMYDVGNKGRSTDGLSTVTALPSLPPSSRYQFGYAGGMTGWIAAYSIIRLSMDNGATWLNREGGYLTTITPTPAIYMIFVPGVTQNHSQQGQV